LYTGKTPEMWESSGDGKRWRSLINAADKRLRRGGRLIMELYILSNFVRTPTTRVPPGCFPFGDNVAIVGVAEGWTPIRGSL
jgi:hypothetical protein